MPPPQFTPTKLTNPSAIQKKWRHGRIPDVIVLHAVTSTHNAEGRWHTLVDNDKATPLEEYYKPTASNRLANLRTLNIGVVTPDENWELLKKLHEHTDYMFQIGYEAVRMADWVHENYGVDIPAQRITKKQYMKGASGFITHAELNPCDCFRNKFPWHDFLNFYRKKRTPNDTRPEVLIAEAAAVSFTPGQLATGLASQSHNYMRLGQLIIDSFKPETVAVMTFFKYNNRRPSKAERKAIKASLKENGLIETVKQISVTERTFETQQQIDRRLLEVQSLPQL